VRVPDDAVNGKAIVRCELSPNCRFQSLPTDLEVEIAGS
jgi:hypothetical protein